jgi:hypothetical protein
MASVGSRSRSVLSFIYFCLLFPFSYYLNLYFSKAMQAAPGRSSVVITETEADDDGYADGPLPPLPAH